MADKSDSKYSTAPPVERSVLGTLSCGSWIGLRLKGELEDVERERSRRAVGSNVGVSGPPFELFVVFVTPARKSGLIVVATNVRSLFECVRVCRWEEVGGRPYREDESPRDIIRISSFAWFSEEEETEGGGGGKATSASGE